MTNRPLRISGNGVEARRLRGTAKEGCKAYVLANVSQRRRTGRLQGGVHLLNEEESSKSWRVENEGE